MQLKNDGWRTYMTQKRALNPAHPEAFHHWKPRHAGR